MSRKIPAQDSVPIPVLLTRKAIMLGFRFFLHALAWSSQKRAQSQSHGKVSRCHLTCQFQISWPGCDRRSKYAPLTASRGSYLAHCEPICHIPRKFSFNKSLGFMAPSRCFLNTSAHFLVELVWWAQVHAETDLVNEKFSEQRTPPEEETCLNH